MKAANYGPLYAACLYPQLAESFRDKGWALAVHGSLARDFDVIAVPWQPDPVPPQLCVDSICSYYGVRQIGDPVLKLHGRLVFTLIFQFGESFIDLSFMPLCR